MKKILALFFVLTFLAANINAETNTLTGSVTTINGRTITITVKYFSDRKWAENMLETLIKGIPALENLYGVPFPEDFDVEVREVTKDKKGEGFIAGKNYGDGRIDIVEGEGVDTLLHEISHFWANEKYFKSIWLMEAYAETYSYLALKSIGLKKEAEKLRIKRFEFFVENRESDVPLSEWKMKTDTITPEVIIGYSKGFVFLLRMREEFGEEKMKEVYKIIFEKKDIDTDDFTQILREISGKDLNYLFLGWIYRGDYKDFWMDEWDSLWENYYESEKKYNNANKNIEEYGLYLDLEKDFSDVKKLITIADFEGSSSMLSEISDKLEKVEEISLKLKELEKTMESNRVNLESYGVIIDVNEKMKYVIEDFERKDFEEVLQRLEDIAEIIEDATIAIESYETLKTNYRTEKIYFERLEFSTEFEEQIKNVEISLERGDYKKAREISENSFSQLNMAINASRKYEEALNTQKDFFIKIGNIFLKNSLKNSKNEFNVGNYEESIKYSENSIKNSKKQKTIGLTISIGVPLIFIILIGRWGK